MITDVRVAEAWLHLLAPLPRAVSGFSMCMSHTSHRRRVISLQNGIARSASGRNDPLQATLLGEP